jgi:FAD synthetase
MLESAGATSDDNRYSKKDAITSITSQGPTPALPELCAAIHKKVETFLNAEPKNERVRAVQAQSRIGLAVIEEALRRYR